MIRNRRRSVQSAALLLAALLLASGCDSPSGPKPAGAAAHLDIVSGDAQSAVVGTALAAPLVVRVTDDKGKKVQGQVVNFRVVAGNGTVFAGTALTDKEGLAQERWTLGTVARDTQKVEARAVDPSTGNPIVFATFKAVGTPDAPAALAKVAGDAQTAPVGLSVADSLAVKLADRYGNPIATQAIAWSVASGGGSVSPASAPTDTSGVVRARWTLGTRLDSAQVAVASFGSLPPVTFAATATVSGTLATVSGDGQTGTVGHVLTDSLVVRLATAGGQPVRGATILWTTAAGSLLPATGRTDATGTVKVAWLLGTAAGPQAAAATVVGGTQAVSFGATGTPDAADHLVKVSGDAQSGSAGTALADSLVVKAVDSHGNAVPGVALAWAVASGGGTVSPSSSFTSADGTGKTRWTLGGRLDSAQVAVVSSGALAPLSFTAMAGASGTLTKVSGDAQSAVVLQPLADSLVVQLTTVGGAPVVGAAVQWTNDFGTLSPASSVTDAEGKARTAWVLANLVGTQSTTATVTGVGSVTFTARALTGPVQRVRLVSGDGQTGTVSAALADSLRVVAVDGFNHPVPGALVRFSPLGGSGSLSPDTTRTRADGTAASRWTLGSNGGLQSAEASVAGADSSATFSATARGTLSLRVFSPDPGPIASAQSVFGDSLAVQVSVQAQFPPAHVVAAVGLRQAVLTCAFVSECTGKISLVGLPRDTMRVTITATDSVGTVATVSVGFIHDNAPVVTLQPVPGNVIGNGVLHAVSTCQDDDPAGCTRLQLRIGSSTSAPVAAGTASIDTTISVSQYQGQTITVTATGTDSRGQATSTRISALVDSATVAANAHVVLGATLSGPVLDATPSQILYRDSTSGAVNLRDRSTGAETLVFTAAPAGVTGFVIPGGAMLDGVLSGHVFEWRAGVGTDLGVGSSLLVNGGWAAWRTPSKLVVRDVAAGSSLQYDAFTSFDLASNGDFVSWSSGGVTARRGGTIVDYPSGVGHITPLGAVVDPTQVVYSLNTQIGPPLYEIHLSTTPIADNTLLVPSGQLWRAPIAGVDFRVNAGWAAYFTLAAGGPYALWRRSPAGAQEQVASVAAAGAVEALGADGAVVYSSGSIPTRYLSAPGSTSVDLGAALPGDRVLWRAGAFVLVRGGAVYQIVP